jgi:RimJ/RimL family protein N-acetyltransferase
VPVLSDGVIRLRPFVEDDADALLYIWSDPDIRKRNTLPELSPAAARSWVAARAALAADGLAWEWAITDFATGELAGRRSIKQINWAESRAVSAAWVGPALRGRRFSPRSLRLAAGHAFANGLARIQVDCEADNAASIRSALTAGARHEGTLRDYWVTNDGVRATVETFSLLPADLATAPPL